MAGILGRIAAALAPFVQMSARRHACFHWRDDSDGVLDPPTLRRCHIQAPTTLLRPGEDLSWSPQVWLYVPPSDLELWLGRITELLEAIASDANDLDTLDLLEGHDDHTPTTVTTPHAEHPTDPATPRQATS
jgi:hypothetical protein